MDYERILQLTAIVRVKMGVLRRRIEGKPGHQHITPLDVIRSVRLDVDEIEDEIKCNAETST